MPVHPNSYKSIAQINQARQRPGNSRNIKIKQEHEEVVRRLGKGSITDGIVYLLDRLSMLTGDGASADHKASSIQAHLEAIAASVENDDSKKNQAKCHEVNPKQF